MSRQRTWFRMFLCAVLSLVLLTPSCLASLAISHNCACGMKRGECSCELTARGKDGHCGSSVEGDSCSLRSQRPAGGDTSNLPKAHFLLDRMAILSSQPFGFEPSPGSAWLDFTLLPLRSFTASPETPPPRGSSPAS